MENTSPATEHPEIPVNLGELPADVTADDSQINWANLSLDEKLLIGAYRRKDFDDMALYVVRILLKQGQSAAQILKAALDTGDANTLRAYTKAVNAHLNPPVLEVWTYERRLALYALGTLAVELPGLPDAMFTDDLLSLNVDTLADGLIRGIHILGCPDHLTLANILDLASSHYDEGGYPAPTEEGGE